MVVISISSDTLRIWEENVSQLVVEILLVQI